MGNNRKTISAQMFEKVRQVIPGGVMSNFRKGEGHKPIYMSHGKGARIWDVDGKDSIAMITANLNLAGFDICCMAPAYDTHGIGGQTAARFYIEIMKQLALKK